MSSVCFSATLCSATGNFVQHTIRASAGTNQLWCTNCSKGADAEPTAMVKLDVGAKPDPAHRGASVQIYTVISEGGNPLPPAPAPPGPSVRELHWATFQYRKQDHIRYTL